MEKIILIKAEGIESFEKQINTALEKGRKIIPNTFKLFQTAHSCTPILYHIIVSKEEEAKK